MFFSNRPTTQRFSWNILLDLFSFSEWTLVSCFFSYTTFYIDNLGSNKLFQFQHPGFMETFTGQSSIVFSGLLVRSQVSTEYLCIFNNSSVLVAMLKYFKLSEPHSSFLRNHQLLYSILQLLLSFSTFLWIIILHKIFTTLVHCFPPFPLACELTCTTFVSLYFQFIDKETNPSDDLRHITVRLSLLLVHRRKLCIGPKLPSSHVMSH